MMTPGRRSYEQSLLATLTELKDRYWIIWAPLFALFVAAGFGFRTPLQTTNKLQVQIDSVRDETSKLRLQQSTFSSRIEMLLRMNCASTTLNKRDAFLLGLDCNLVLPTKAGSAQP